MEKVNDLFRAFRAGQIKQDDIFRALLVDIQQDRRFCQQAVALLDQVQRTIPLPVTDFIELRARVDKAVALQIERQPQPVVMDPDATTVFSEAGQVAESDATLAPGTATVNADIDTTLPPTQPGLPAAGAEADAAPAASSEAGLPPAPAAEQLPVAPLQPASEPLGSDGPPAQVIETPENDQEATVIMPVAPRKRPAQAAAAVQAPEPIASASTVDLAATVISPAAAITASAPAPAPANAMDADSAATWIASPSAAAEVIPSQADQIHSALHEPIPSKPVATPTPLPTSKSTLPNKTLLWAGAGGVAGVVLLALLWVVFSSPSEPEPVVDSVTPDATQPINTTSELAQPAPAPATDTLQTASSPLEPAPEAIATPAPDTTATATSDAALPESESIPSTTPAELTVTPVSDEPPDALDERLDWYFERLSKAADAGNLLPADQNGTATFYLVAMLTEDPSNELIPQARARISKAHTELARQARLKGQWDRVQEHLDAAMEVNLPYSFRP